MMHTLKLDDLELTVLMTHLEGQSEIMNESRLNSSDPYTPDREEILLNLVYTCLLYTSPSPRDDR